MLQTYDKEGDKSVENFGDGHGSGWIMEPKGGDPLALGLLKHVPLKFVQLLKVFVLWWRQPKKSSISQNG